MSAKKLDEQGRFRGYTTAFRMSPEEHTELNHFVALSGLSKQDYMIKRALNKEIIVMGNMRTFKALRNHMDKFIISAKRCIENQEKIDDEALNMMKYVVDILEGLSKDVEE